MWGLLKCGCMTTLLPILSWMTGRLSDSGPSAKLCTLHCKGPWGVKNSDKPWSYWVRSTVWCTESWSWKHELIEADGNDSKDAGLGICSYQMSDVSESLIFLSKSLFRSFLDKTRAIRSEIKWENSQPCKDVGSNPCGWIMLKKTQAMGLVLTAEPI